MHFSPHEKLENNKQKVNNNCVIKPYFLPSYLNLDTKHQSTTRTLRPVFVGVLIE